MNQLFKTTSLFTYQIFSGTLNELKFHTRNSDNILICTINPHSFYVADHDKEFKTALEQSELLLPDGVGIVYANWLINNQSLKKISGMDIFLFLLSHFEQQPDQALKRIFFLGSTESTLARIKEKINDKFPSLKVGYFSPAFKPVFSNEDQDLMINSINSFDPYVLFTGMTAPKQEKWSYQNKAKLNAHIICSIGAVFDFYSGNIKRPGKIWQILGLEWLGRFLREPRRLWKRSLISLPYFIVKVFQEALKKTFRDT